jgi:hypothetical protein
MSITLFKVKDKKIFKTDFKKLEEDSIYIIIDRHAKRPRIYVWSGNKSDNKDRYFAGVSATSIKSNEHLYGASIEVIEEGSEPESFPKIADAEVESVANNLEEYTTEIPVEISLSKSEESGKAPITTQKKTIKAQPRQEPESWVIEKSPKTVQQDEEKEKTEEESKLTADRLGKQKLKSMLKRYLLI